MFDNFQYASILGNLFFFLIWIFLFLNRRDLRKEILIMSLIVAPMGPLSELFYLRDYWQPEFFNSWSAIIENLFFAFTIGGVASVIYEEFFGKKYAKRHLTSHQKYMFGIALFGIIFMLTGCLILGFNSIYVSIFGFLIIGLFMIALRNDLLKNTLFSGLLVGIIMFVFYFIFGNIFNNIIQRWWLLKNISGIVIFNAPLEELLWGFSWGFVASPTYEFIVGLKLKSK